MGTTLTAVALVSEDGKDVLALVNVGDSRSYRFHDGELSQITTDHSLAEEMVRTGELTSTEASVHPHRHILTRALGCVVRRGGGPLEDSTGSRRPLPPVQ
jgi:serine/threonine protein phosphatase PrpC